MQPNMKQKLAGHAIVGLIGLLLGAAVTDGKVAEAIFAGLVGVAVHELLNVPVTNYIASHPREFPRYLAQ